MHIFIHGAGSNADFWHLQHKAFPQAHYVNLPGHGRGTAVAPVPPDWMGEPHTLMARYASWIVDYVERAHLTNVVLNGHSMGGAVALEVALAKPEWLRGLILTCTGPRFLITQQLMQMLRDNYTEAVDFIIAESFGWHSTPLSYAQKVRRDGTRKQMLRTPQQVALADYEASLTFDVRDRLGEISVPTLVTVGEQDRITPPLLSRELHAGIPNSMFELQQGAGHMLPMEAPQEYNALVANCLDMPYNKGE
jgi:pimeloyl-ACP methyl ester carboxylesterase